MHHRNIATLVESARVGADSLRSNPMRTVLATTGVIIGVASLVAAFAITDGVDVWSRELIARESSVMEERRGAPVIVLGHRTVEAVDSLRVETVNWLAERYGPRLEKLDVVVGTERLENTKQAMLLSR